MKQVREQDLHLAAECAAAQSLFLILKGDYDERGGGTRQAAVRNEAIKPPSSGRGSELLSSDQRSWQSKVVRRFCTKPYRI